MTRDRMTRDRMTRDRMTRDRMTRDRMTRDRMTRIHRTLAKYLVRWPRARSRAPSDGHVPARPTHASHAPVWQSGTGMLRQHLSQTSSSSCSSSSCSSSFGAGPGPGLGPQGSSGSR
jgi:hypothetical protein